MTSPRPSFLHEKQLSGVVCGVDEAGRGPLAGPVVAAAVILPQTGLPKILKDGIDDSKRLTHEKREGLFPLIMEHALGVGVGMGSVEEIDRHNILKATFTAMCRAIEALPQQPDFALIDGNLVPKGLPCKGMAIVKGDQASFSIAAASIIAKVTRDRLMKDLATAHPHYGWDHNAGYGTAEHLAALAAHGLTPHHRLSFAPVAAQQEMGL